MNRIVRSSKLLPLLCVVSLLASCGGEDGGNSVSNTPATQTQSSDIPSLSISSTSVSVQRDTSAPGIFTQTLTLTVQNADKRPSDAFLVSKPSWNGLAIHAVHTSSVGNSTTDVRYDVTISFWGPNSLGAGTYHGNIQIEMCYDFQCTIKAPGSPVSVAVTYTVTGDPAPDTRFSLTPSTSIYLESISTATAGPLQQGFVSFTNPGPIPHFSFNQPSDGFVASLDYHVSGLDNGRFDLRLDPPGDLSLGAHSSTLKINVCLDEQCAHPLQGSPVSIPITYMITASAGRDYDMRTLDLRVTDVAWSAVTQKIYAAISQYSTSHSKALLEVEPQSGAPVRSTPLSGEPSRISISDDGAYAYVGFRDTPEVQRIRLEDMTTDISIPLGSDATYGPYATAYLEVRPGNPHSVAIARYLPLEGFRSGAVVLYDDATARPEALGDTTQWHDPQSIAWNDDGSMLYATDDQGLLSAAAAPSGLVQVGEYQGATLSAIQYYAGRIYGAAAGNIFDLSSSSMVGSFTHSGGGPMAIDPALRRVYGFFGGDENLPNTPPLTLRIYDLDQLTPICMARFTGMHAPTSGIPGIPGALVRWGSNGVAFYTGTKLVILNGTFIAP